MREPRPRQRLPEGGLEIFERRKDGKWTSPLLVFAQPEGWCHPREKPRSKEFYLRTGYVVIYQPHFDPMVYFWPVDGCHLVIRTQDPDSDHTQRLVRAGLRDGAELVVTHTIQMLSTYTRFFDQESGWQKPVSEFEHAMRPPKKKTRYQVTLEAIRDAERAQHD